MVSSALRYVLSQDIAVTIPGLKSILEVETAACVGENYAGLTTREKERFSVDLGKHYCRDCGFCMPCPEKVNVAATLRFELFYSVNGLNDWAKKLYGSLEVKADKCTGCGECESKCPYNLPISNKLKEAHEKLTS